MKITTKLGVATEAELRHPTSCFTLSKALTRLSDALAFGEFYLREAKGLNPRDFEHMSAAVYTSGRAADDLASLVDKEALRTRIKRYSAEAQRFNQDLRAQIKGKKTKKPLDLEKVKSKTEKLRKDVAEIEKEVESLCKVDKPNVAPQAMKGGLGSPVRKRPIYPRYVVASMGRRNSSH